MLAGDFWRKWGERHRAEWNTEAFFKVFAAAFHNWICDTCGGIGGPR